jgi:hypothetical protein
MPTDKYCTKGKIRAGPLLSDGVTRRCVIPCDKVSDNTKRKARDLVDRCGRISDKKKEGRGGNISKLLSDKEVMKLAGKDSKVITYPEIQDYDSIPQLFGRKNKVIILYLNEKNGNNYVGHWVLLLRCKRNGKTIIEFNDSYSNYIDEYFDDIPKSKRKSLDQEHGYLSRLLYDYCKDNDKVELHYNEYPFQKLKENVNTCGRWVGLRGKFSQVPLEDYQNAFKKLKGEGYDLDKIITIATDKLLEDS